MSSKKISISRENQYFTQALSKIKNDTESLVPSEYDPKEVKASSSTCVFGISKAKKRNISGIQQNELLKKSKKMKIREESKEYIRKMVFKKESPLKNPGGKKIWQVNNAEKLKRLKKHNNEITEIDTSTEQKLKRKGPDTTVSDINKAVSNELEKIQNACDKYVVLPIYLKSRITDTVSNCKTEWKKLGTNKVYSTAILFIESELQHLMQKLCSSLSHNNYDLALQSLEQINELQLNGLMLKKNEQIIDTIINVINYFSNNLTSEHRDSQTQILLKAKIVYNKFQSLFTVANGATFLDVFQKQVENFHKNTKHLSQQEINSITILMGSMLLSIPK